MLKDWSFRTNITVQEFSGGRITRRIKAGQGQACAVHRNSVQGFGAIGPGESKCDMLKVQVAMDVSDLL